MLHKNLALYQTGLAKRDLQELKREPNIGSSGEEGLQFNGCHIDLQTSAGASKVCGKCKQLVGQRFKSGHRRK